MNLVIKTESPGGAVGSISPGVEPRGYFHTGSIFFHKELKYRNLPKSFWKIGKSPVQILEKNSSSVKLWESSDYFISVTEADIFRHKKGGKIKKMKKNKFYA